MTDDLMALADAVFETPAGRDPGSEVRSSSAVATTGGPVEDLRLTPGEEPTPGSAAATDNAARESTGVVAGAGAAFPSGEGRAGGASPAPGAVSGFAVPVTRVPLTFGVGPLYDALYDASLKP